MDPESPYCKWRVRKKIALEVARGMKYLHHNCDPPIVHRDMKPANVLMDDCDGDPDGDPTAHVADFGLAVNIETGQSMTAEEVFGTVGYVAPEYSRTGRMGFKSDVYAYGVTLLQLVTGRQPQDAEVGDGGLARWVGTKAVTAVLDPNIQVEEEEFPEVGYCSYGTASRYATAGWPRMSVHFDPCCSGSQSQGGRGMVCLGGLLVIHYSSVTCIYVEEV